MAYTPELPFMEDTGESSPGPTLKTCTRCLKASSLDSFHRHSGRADGRNSICRGCKSLVQRERKYGIQAEALVRMLAVQEGSCSICRKRISMETMVVDHNHRTGEISGCLCSECNLGLGKLGDGHDLALLHRLFAYAVKTRH